MNAINDTRLEVIGFGAVPASVDEQRAMARELISLRAQVADLRGQEPVAWTDAEELRDLAAHKCAYLYKIDPDNPYHDPRRQIMIYRRPVLPTVLNNDVVSAMKDVIAERQRQISAEGWTPEHDDEHSMGELALAGSCYAYAAGCLFPGGGLGYHEWPSLKFWPWGEECWKPSNPRRDLVKAGALILAEIERLDRAEAKDGDA
ncbi:hypothetical protein [Pectobacterium odoriferum]|uniref:hypothetical protein n=1 Tax=Pectobacterium odoriferum TaxID=78398 RepID=UPI001AD6F7FD|nr:hypothetical protein [Pectobacterium odoriferum]